MGKVIDFKDKLSIKEEDISTQEGIKVVIDELQNQAKAGNIKDILFFVKDSEDNFIMYYNDLSVQEKSFLSMMLQHDVFQELTQDEEDEEFDA